MKTNQKYNPKNRRLPSRSALVVLAMATFVAVVSGADKPAKAGAEKAPAIKLPEEIPVATYSQRGRNPFVSKMERPPTGGGEIQQRGPDWEPVFGGTIIGGLTRQVILNDRVVEQGKTVTFVGEDETHTVKVISVMSESATIEIDGKRTATIKKRDKSDGSDGGSSPRKSSSPVKITNKETGGNSAPEGESEIQKKETP